MTAGILRRTVLIFGAAVAVAGAGLIPLYRMEVAATDATLRKNEDDALGTVQRLVTRDLGTIASDVRYLAVLPSMDEWLTSGTTAARHRLTTQFLAFASYRTSYDQVRFIDARGQEVVRINRRDGNVHAVADGALQKKADRYYVTATLALRSGEVFMSPFDLNVENGAIEQPLNPTIRFAAPIVDRYGRTAGLVIVNFRGEELIDHIRAIAASRRTTIWLANARGYWLIGPRPDDEWGFMYPDGRTRTVGTAFPAAWRRLEAAKSDTQAVIGGDLFTALRLYPARVVRSAGGPSADVPLSPSWIALTRISAASLAAATAPLDRLFAAIAAVTVLVLAAVAWAIARQWTMRKLAEQSIRHSEARFRSLLESAPDPIVVTDSSGAIQLVNDRTEQLFGYPRDELVGRPVDMLVPDRLRQSHAHHRSGYVAAPQARRMGAGLDLCCRRRDGSEIPVDISLSPIATDRGKLVFCAIRDITEQRLADRRIRELNDRLAQENAALEAVNRELEAFSYSVSHDLRAPLRAIDGFSQALLEDCADRLDETGRDHLTRVRRATQRMGDLIDDLLKLARVTRTEISPSAVDLGAMASHFADVLRQRSPDRQVEFAIDRNLTTFGDPRLLRVAMENLMDNAWKFTAERSPGRISIGRMRENGSATYFIRDNGAGFDMAYADKLFGVFQRLHDDRRFPGTGVGLATVQRVIHKHGGEVWAEAEHEKGATFYFTLRCPQGKENPA